MIIYERNAVGIIVYPPKNDSPLVINPNAIIICEVSFQ